jgi:hypothetical protein
MKQYLTTLIGNVSRLFTGSAVCEILGAVLLANESCGGATNVIGPRQMRVRRSLGGFDDPQPDRSRIQCAFSSRRMLLLLALLVFADTSHAQPVWDVRGYWNIAYYVQNGSYSLPLTITNEDFSAGTFTGVDNAGYPISGAVSGSSIQFGDSGYPGWSLSFNGVITTNGTLVGGQGYPGGMTYYNYHGAWGGWFWTYSGQAVLFGVPTFTVQPVNQVVKAGQPVTFNASATGIPTPSYQWQFNGTNITDATNSSYSLSSTSITDIGLYDVMAFSSAGTNISARASLTFLDIQMFPGLVIYGPPGASYAIQSMPSVSGGSNWTTITNVILPSIQPYFFIDLGAISNQAMFYRAVPR